MSGEEADDVVVSWCPRCGKAMRMLWDAEPPLNGWCYACVTSNEHSATEEEA